MNFKVLSQAGITQQQFADMAGVSRITVNTWVTGRYKPRPQHRELVSRLLKAVAAAIDAGHLPIESTDSRLAKRLEQIRKSATRRG